ncbi:NUDIX domain-containing protein [Polaromonas sp.]|uniref:NUDIX hydrolase n=1 Tax=Polaromonas sp. TaxID=1869339 RepID=UPI00248A17D6|nr:NUDIX domain-containing protein [Polaromonas sp.]MDI1274087.1 NUDIX domain-containing protein [Polaromonas sp.]
MKLPTPDPDYLRTLHAAATQPPLRPRVPLWAGEVVIGSVEPEFLSKIVLQPLPDGREKLLKEERFGEPGWHLQGELSAGLHQIAAALHQLGLAGAWRDEQLAVADAQGQVLGTVERAAVRPLGIVTRAVHLVGQTSDGRFWVQQRALDKPNDPGLWDTLMGGMVSAEDTLDSALARETWEEAGLHLADLQALRYGGRIHTCRPARDGGGAGYLQEYLDWYHCTVPDGVTPVNQDGEVACFALMDGYELLQKMRDGEFTLEAALIQAALLA